METFQPVLSLFSAFLAVIAKFKHRNLQSFDHEPETNILVATEAGADPSLITLPNDGILIDYLKLFV